MKMFTALVDGVGIVLIGAAAFTVSIGLGLLALGVGVVLFGLAMER